MLSHFLSVKTNSNLLLVYKNNLNIFYEIYLKYKRKELKAKNKITSKVSMVLSFSVSWALRVDKSDPKAGFCLGSSVLMTDLALPKYFLYRSSMAAMSPSFLPRLSSNEEILFSDEIIWVSEITLI